MLQLRVFQPEQGISETSLGVYYLFLFRKRIQNLGSRIYPLRARACVCVCVCMCVCVCARARMSVSLCMCVSVIVCIMLNTNETWSVKEDELI